MWCTFPLLLAFAFGRAKRMSGDPAVKSKEPMDAACPMHIVQISGRTYCMVSYTANPAVTIPPGLISISVQCKKNEAGALK